MRNLCLRHYQDISRTFYSPYSWWQYNLWQTYTGFKSRHPSPKYSSLRRSNSNLSKMSNTVYSAILKKVKINISLFCFVFFPKRQVWFCYPFSFFLCSMPKRNNKIKIAFVCTTVSKNKVEVGCLFGLVLSDILHQVMYYINATQSPAKRSPWLICLNKKVHRCHTHKPFSGDSWTVWPLQTHYNHYVYHTNNTILYIQYWLFSIKVLSLHKIKTSNLTYALLSGRL